MIPCPCCSAPFPTEPYGIQYSGSVPALILLECPGTRADGTACRTTRAIRYTDASDELRERAGREE